jgi:isopentenyl-diphosphate Delta-isomerase
MNNLDQVILIDKNNKPIGQMDKIDAHRGEGKFHRAVSVFLFNSKGQLLIQQRSNKKIVGALEWANTACANVRPGESTTECAHRRLREELGIENVTIKPVYIFQYQLQCNNDFSENELDEVFVGEYEGDVKPNPNEVADFMWVDFNDLIGGKESLKGRTIVPWLKLMLKDKQLINKIKQI